MHAEPTGHRALRGLYSLVIRLALPVSLYYLIWRGLRQREYFDRWSERFALYRVPGLDGCVWVHAVSVGEVNVAAPLVAALRARDPGLPVLVTTTTPTGSARVRALWGDQVRHVYLPYDLPGAVRNFLDHFRPRVAVVIETEIWPNLFAEAQARGIPLLIANARLSERSLRGYRPIAALVEAALGKVSAVAAQSEADAARYRRLGADPARVQVTGNIKYDLPVPAGLVEQASAWRRTWGKRPVWIAASTHPGEEEAMREAHRAVRARHPDALLLWAPRHPERFAAVAADAEQGGLRVATRRRDGLPRHDTEVFVVDTLGELMAFFAAADVAFVGGSLQDVGGHNVLEPAVFGKPIVFGPHMQNFLEIAEAFVSNGAGVQLAGEAQLEEAFLQLMGDPVRRARLGAAARALVEANRGANEKSVTVLAALLPQEPRAYPANVRPFRPLA